MRETEELEFGGGGDAVDSCGTAWSHGGKRCAAEGGLAGGPWAAASLRRRVERLGEEWIRIAVAVSVAMAAGGLVALLVQATAEGARVIRRGAHTGPPAPAAGGAGGGGDADGGSRRAGPGGGGELDAGGGGGAEVGDGEHRAAGAPRSCRLHESEAVQLDVERRLLRGSMTGMEPEAPRW